MQRKSLPPLSSGTLSAEQEDCLSSQPAEATEEPTELSSPPTHQIVPEPPLTVQTAATIFPVRELCKTPATARAHAAAQEETTVLPVQVFPGDTERPDAQVSVSVISTLQPVHTATTITTSLPLNSVVSSVLPVLSPPTQTSQPEVD